MPDEYNGPVIFFSKLKLKYRDDENVKIDIITFHFVSNCGAVLQCFASQKFLEMRGHDVNIIDYRPEYHTIRYQAIKNPFVFVKYFRKQLGNKGVIKKILLETRAFAKCIYLNLNTSERTVAHLFDSFVKKNLRLTRLYVSLDQLREDPPSADVYITGSDQLWNPDLLDACFDPAYFLKFGRDSIIRISYAVSIVKKLSQYEKAELHDMCKNLNAISIREYNKDVIESIGSDVHICIDPTLLLTADDYASIESDLKETDPYIFVYGFEDNEKLHEVIKIVQSKYKIRIINGCPHRIKLRGDVFNLSECGPAEFLTMIKNTAFVVTNSFHGTAFSIIYRKEFITLVHSIRGSRMTELLSKLNLQSRLWESSDFNMDLPVDWELVEEKLMVLRKQSSEFLLSALTGEKGVDIPNTRDE